MAKKTDSSPDPTTTAPQTECCNCQRVVGDGPRVQAFVVDGETWCPRCFVGKRVWIDSRFYAPAFTAVLCRSEACGWEGTAMGTNWCPCCRSRSTLVLQGTVAA